MLCQVGRWVSVTQSEGVPKHSHFIIVLNSAIRLWYCTIVQWVRCEHDYGWTHALTHSKPHKLTDSPTYAVKNSHSHTLVTLSTYRRPRFNFLTPALPPSLPVFSEPIPFFSSPSSVFSTCSLYLACILFNNVSLHSPVSRQSRL